MESTIEDRIKTIMAEALEIQANEIDCQASPRTTRNWNGSTHSRLVDALENEFNIAFEDSEVETLVSFTIVVATVKAYLS